MVQWRGWRLWRLRLSTRRGPKFHGFSLALPRRMPSSMQLPRLLRLRRSRTFVYAATAERDGGESKSRESMQLPQTIDPSPPAGELRRPLPRFVSQIRAVKPLKPATLEEEPINATPTARSVWTTPNKSDRSLEEDVAASPAPPSSSTTSKTTKVSETNLCEGCGFITVYSRAGARTVCSVCHASSKRKAREAASPEAGQSANEEDAAWEIPLAPFELGGPTSPFSLDKRPRRPRPRRPPGNAPPKRSPTSGRKLRPAAQGAEASPLRSTSPSLELPALHLKVRPRVSKSKSPLGERIKAKSPLEGRIACSPRPFRQRRRESDVNTDDANTDAIAVLEAELNEESQRHFHPHVLQFIVESESTH